MIVGTQHHLGAHNMPIVPPAATSTKQEERGCNLDEAEEERDQAKGQAASSGGEEQLKRANLEVSEVVEREEVGQVLLHSCLRRRALEEEVVRALLKLADLQRLALVAGDAASAARLLEAAEWTIRRKLGRRVVGPVNYCGETKYAGASASHSERVVRDHIPDGCAAGRTQTPTSPWTM